MLELQCKQTPAQYEFIKHITDVELLLDEAKLGTDFEKAYKDLKLCLSKPPLGLMMDPAVAQAMMSMQYDIDTVEKKHKKLVAERRKHVLKILSLASLAIGTGAVALFLLRRN